MSARVVRSGFTLLEVVIALVVFEVAVVGLVGMLTLASATLSRAETLERQVAAVEGVLDSLGRGAAVGADSILTAAGSVLWSVDEAAGVRVVARDPRGEVIVEVESVLPR